MPIKKRNAFYYYMKHIQDLEKKKGNFMSMQSVQNLAGPKWQKLPPEEKQRYEEEARKHKNDPHLRTEKLASDGTRVEENLRKLDEIKRMENQMRQNVKQYINPDGISEYMFREFASHKPLYFIAFNILCCIEEEEYIPIEIGLVEYTIQNGIHREYHRILHPGAIPLGSKGDAKRISDDKHQIDIFGKDSNEKDMRTVYNDIMKFTCSEDDELLPLFALDTEIPIVEGCLNWLSRRAGMQNYFDVWSSTDLLFELRSGINHGLPSRSMASDLLHKPSFDYHPNTKCEFHEEKDIPHCALGYAKRLCFLTSDAVCQLFDVELTDRHIPSLTTEEKPYTVRTEREPFSRQSSVSNVSLARSVKDYQSGSDAESTQNESLSSYASASAASVIKQPTHRQPSSDCIAAKMRNLNLNISSATVPGHGIGRGRRIE